MQIPSLLCAGNQQDREPRAVREPGQLGSDNTQPLGAVQGSRAVVKTRLDLPDPPSLLESSSSTPGIPKGT